MKKYKFARELSLGKYPYYIVYNYSNLRGSKHATINSLEKIVIFLKNSNE